MPSNEFNAPKSFKGVMISSTFTDLEQHRQALIDSIQRQSMMPLGMEQDAARLTDVITSSLEKVRQASGYIAVIGSKYGQIPVSPTQNPRGLSLTELEFHEAVRLNRPILLFLMGDEHPVPRKDIETDPDKQKKLEEFRRRAMQMGPDSSVHRVYATFNSLEDFKLKALQSLTEMRRYFDEQDRQGSTWSAAPTRADSHTPRQQSEIPTDRGKFILFLTRQLNEEVFDKLILVLGIPVQYMPGRSAGLATRISEMIRWAESPMGCGLEKVRQATADILNP
jgi:hypothetical protein